MPVHKTIYHAAIITLLIAEGIAVSAHAEEEATNVSSNAAPLVTKLIDEDVRGLPPITRAYLTTGTNRFAFLIPRGFRLDASSPEKIIITAKDQSGFILLRRIKGMTFPANEKATSVDTKTCRKLLLKEHPGARIKSEFSRTAAGRTGPAYDFDFNVTSGVVQTGRAVFIPTDVGIMEFKLVSKPKEFRSATYKLNNLLLSFCASEAGKLEVVRLSDKL